MFKVSHTLLKCLALSIILVTCYHSPMFLLKNVAASARMQSQVEGHRRGFTEAAELYKKQECRKGDLRS